MWAVFVNLCGFVTAADLIPAALSAIPGNEERLLIATSRYLGEGFDDAQLGKLFLTMPISWRGTLPNMQAACTGPCNKIGSIVFDYAGQCTATG